MKRLIMPVVTIVFLAACTAVPPPVPPVATNASVHEEAQQKPLFLHLLTPDVPPRAARRIASTRVYLSRDFSVSVGVLDNAFTNSWDGAVTTPLVNTNGVPEPRPLSSMWDSGDAVLAGRIDARQGKLFAHLQGRNQTSLNYFHGEIELEKPVEEHGIWFRGGVVWGVWFVLSENPSCAAFLRKLDDGTLQSPSVVARDSPEAKRWLELDSSKSSGPTP